MKLVKIFGMVLALHIVLLTVFFLSPGCQSTPQKPVEVAQPLQSAPPPAASENWTNQPAGYSGGTGSALTPTTVDTRGGYPSAPLSGLTPAERARMAPSRPANPQDFLEVPSTTTSAGSAGRASAATPSMVEYTVKPGDSLWRISREFGTSVGEIVAANPGVKADALKPGDVLKIPATVAASNPAQAAGAVPAAAAVTSAAATSTYTVRAGDSLSRIAARNGTTVAALRSINNLTSDVIQIGQVLVVPGGEAGPAPGPAREAAPSDAVTVTVQRGDTLGAIARKFDVSVRDLMRVNNITDPRRVRAGQVLVIPGYEAVGTGQVPSPARTFSVPAGSSQPTSQPAPAAAPAPESTAPEDIPALEPATGDLDDLLPDDVLDAPVVPIIDEPVPQP